MRCICFQNDHAVMEFSIAAQAILLVQEVAGAPLPILEAEEAASLLDAAWKTPGFGGAFKFALEYGVGKAPAVAQACTEVVAESRPALVEPEGGEADRGRGRPALTKSQCDVLCEGLQLGYRWVPWRPLVPWWDVEHEQENPGQLVLLVPRAQASSGPSAARTLPSSASFSQRAFSSSLWFQRGAREHSEEGPLARGGLGPSTPRSEDGLIRGGALKEASVFTVVPYLLANGVRLARLAYEGMSEVPEVSPGTGAGQVNASVSQVHVFFELGDHLGSTSVVLDKATSELVERSTFQGYGATESDYRPGRWNAFREDYRFTGKEEDAEVGLTYFGKRYLNAYLGRWISADPLAIHAPGEADLNVYAYVSGSFLKNVDPLGLEEEAVEQESKVSVDEVVDYAQELSYISASAGDREWFRGFLESGSAIDQELSGYWEQHREEFINSPLDSTEKAAFDYLQSQGTAREQFMQLRAGARAYIYDNMPGFDFGSNGSERSYAEETKRGKPASNIFYHWMGLGMDWQLTLGPRSGAQQEGRMIAAEGTSNQGCQVCLNMRSDVLTAYNDAIAQIADQAQVSPGQWFQNSQKIPTPHPEHFQIQVFRGEPVTKATEMKVMMGAPGYDQKPLQIEVLVPKKGGEQR